jgi:hypothetical protein
MRPERVRNISLSKDEARVKRLYAGWLKDKRAGFQMIILRDAYRLGS